MIYLLLDDPRGQERLGALRSQFDDSTLRDANTHDIDGQRATIEGLRSACLSYPFLATKRLVVVTGLVGRLQAAGRRQARGAAARPQSESGGATGQEEQNFARFLAEVPDHTDLILLERAPWRDGSLFIRELVKASAEIVRPLQSTELPVWIQQRVKSKGGAISSATASLLAGRVGNDLQALDQELEKLVVYADGETITGDAVNALVPGGQEASIFTLIDRATEGNAQAALGELHRILVDGAPPQVIAMLSRQFRLLLLWKEQIGAGVSPAEVALAIGVKDFVAGKLGRQARRYSIAQIEAIYRSIVQIDLASKTSRGDPVVHLETLIVDLALRTTQPALTATAH